MNFYYGGIYFEEDYTKAYELYKKSCDMGDNQSCSFVGVMLFYGYGVDKNENLGLEILKDSCSKNELLSCQILKNIDKYDVNATIKSII